MESSFATIPEGTVTTPQGFCAGAVHAGIKYKNDPLHLDLGVLFAEAPASIAAMFTDSQVKAAPVLLSMERARDGRASALVVNSGCANAVTGAQGAADAAETAALTASALGVSEEDVLVASTGVIGQMLPMAAIREALPRLVLTGDGGHDLAHAILTTDTVPKEIALCSKEYGFTIGGIAKGSGMIHPDMATMLVFLTTDAAAGADYLQDALRAAVAKSFNMITVDTDTSTNDTVLLMAGGKSGVDLSEPGAGQVFREMLDEVCQQLAKMLLRDAEGATRLIEVQVSGAPGEDEARHLARLIAASPLVKTAVHGSDPNWGRVLAVVGRCGFAVDVNKIDLSIAGVPLLRAGRPLGYDHEQIVRALGMPEVTIGVALNGGGGVATAWGCDLSEEYVTINSEYTT